MIRCFMHPSTCIFCHPTSWQLLNLPSSLIVPCMIFFMFRLCWGSNPDIWVLFIEIYVHFFIFLYGLGHPYFKRTPLIGHELREHQDISEKNNWSWWKPCNKTWPKLWIMWQMVNILFFGTATCRLAGLLQTLYSCVILLLKYGSKLSYHFYLIVRHQKSKVVTLPVLQPPHQHSLWPMLYHSPLYFTWW